MLGTVRPCTFAQPTATRSPTDFSRRHENLFLFVPSWVPSPLRWARRETQSVAVLGMRNGTSQSPFRPALGRQLVRAADAPLRGHGFGTSRLRQTPTTNGLTAYRMRLHLACVSSGTYGPFATSASRSRLRLPRTTRLALRASLAGSERPPPRSPAQQHAPLPNLLPHRLPGQPLVSTEIIIREPCNRRLFFLLRSDLRYTCSFTLSG